MERDSFHIKCRHGTRFSFWLETSTFQYLRSLLHILSEDCEVRKSITIVEKVYTHFVRQLKRSAIYIIPVTQHDVRELARVRLVTTEFLLSKSYVEGKTLWICPSLPLLE
jgi:hypothetical protein